MTQARNWPTLRYKLCDLLDSVRWLQSGRSHGEVNTGPSVLSCQSVSMMGQLLAEEESADAYNFPAHSGRIQSKHSWLEMHESFTAWWLISMASSWLWIHRLHWASDHKPKGYSNSDERYKRMWDNFQNK